MKLHLSKHPKELWILSLTELCERFAFWGVGNLLVLYLIEYYHYPNAHATQIYGIFTGFAAFLPFFGGYVADRWNYQMPLLIGAIANAVGCFFLATGVHSFMIIALIMLALGFGIFTPSLVSVLGYSYRNVSSLREAGFSIYYASINVGVFLAMLSLGTIAKEISWNVAFFVAGCVQTLGLIPLFVYLAKHKDTYRDLHKHKKSISKAPLKPHEKDRLIVLGVFCLVSIFFWAAYNQGFSSMAIFIHSFMNKMIGGFDVPSGVFLSSESFFLLPLAPLLGAMYLKLQKVKKDPSASTKTAWSLVFLAACFFVMAMASLGIGPQATSAKVSSGYVIGAYFLMAVGEMLLGPISLSIMTRLAPARYTALSVGMWYLCVGVAFYSGGSLAGLMDKTDGLFNFFLIFVAIALIPAILLFFFTKKLTQLSHFHLDVPQKFTHVEK